MKGQGIDIKSLSSRSVLTVTNMTEDRYGNYTCVASNKLGTANASVPLIRKLPFYLLVIVTGVVKSVVKITGGLDPQKCSGWLHYYIFLLKSKLKPVLQIGAHIS